VGFAVMAIAYRSNHPQGSVGWHVRRNAGEL